MSIAHPNTNNSKSTTNNVSNIHTDQQQRGYSNSPNHHHNHNHNQQSILEIEKSFDKKAKQFIKKTENHALQGLNPGGIYQAIWCRDASFILKSWFHSGNIHGLLQQISTIWSHQIEVGKEKIVYGRGSPEMDYKPTKAKEETQKKFEGALPTTIYQAGYSEIYGLNPDIDSTALIISTTSWILTKILKEKQTINEDTNIDYQSKTSHNPSLHLSKYSKLKFDTNPQKVVDFVIPKMIKAIDYLCSRDIDNDGILEQNHNEDWMDTGLRSGKIVYSQASFILALNNLAYLLSEIGQDNECKKMIEQYNKTIQGVENKLWSEKDNSYIDILESHHIGGPYRILTQDVSLYVVAISENTNSDTLRIAQIDNNNDSKGQHGYREHPLKQRGKENFHQDSSKEQGTVKKNNDDKNLDILYHRSNRTLDAIKEKVWLDSWPTNIETLLKASGPLHLKPYFYHNRTFWPWITGIEMISRSRFDRFDECNTLLSKLASEDDIHILTFYEWVDPKTGKGGGAYPFRTGVCTVRNAIDHIIQGIENKNNENTSN